MSIDEMIQAIEEVVCIRKLWNCNAGWGMSFVLTEEQRAEYLPESLALAKEQRNKSTTFKYYGSVEECVSAEYAVWVRGEPRPDRKR